MEGGNKSIKRYKWKLNFTSVTEKIDKNYKINFKQMLRDLLQQVFVV